MRLTPRSRSRFENRSCTKSAIPSGTALFLHRNSLKEQVLSVVSCYLEKCRPGWHLHTKRGKKQELFEERSGPCYWYVWSYYEKRTGGESTHREFFCFLPRGKRNRGLSMFMFPLCALEKVYSATKALAEIADSGGVLLHAGIGRSCRWRSSTLHLVKQPG